MPVLTSAGTNVLGSTCWDQHARTHIVAWERQKLSTCNLINEPSQPTHTSRSISYSFEFITSTLIFLPYELLIQSDARQAV